MSQITGITTLSLISVHTGTLVTSQNDVVLTPPLPFIDTVKDVTGFTVLPLQEPHSQMPVLTQAYSSYAMSLP